MCGYRLVGATDCSDLLVEGFWPSQVPRLRLGGQLCSPPPA